MYINLDVVMRLVQIGLVIAGIGALITLAMLFKNLIGTLHALTGTLDLLQKDLAKLEGPLDTVDELSATVSDIQHSAKRAANTAIDTFQASSSHLMQWVESKTPLPKKDEQPKEEQPKADFKPVEKAPEADKPDGKTDSVENTPDNGVIVEEVIITKQTTEKSAEPAQTEEAKEDPNE